MEESILYHIPNISLDKTPRPDQVKMLEFTKQSIKDNNKFILLDAPVGSGKSYYSVMFMDWFKNNYDVTATFDILTNSKILQEQYTKDFEFMNSLWGKGSYECEQHQTSCESGMAYNKLLGTKCEDCPYKIAKYKFDNGTVALSNFHLYLTYQLFVPAAWKRDSRVLIIDEAHEFETVYCDFITTDINKFVLRRNGFDDFSIQQAMNLFHLEMNEEDFVSTVTGPFLDIAKRVLAELVREFTETESIQTLERAQTLERNITKWEMLGIQFASNPDNWICESEMKRVFDKSGKSKEEYLEIKVQPVWAYPYLPQLWEKYDYVICMSGTILDKNIFSKQNGLDANRTTYLSLDSAFPVENRPIYFFNNIGKQTYATKDIVFGKQTPFIDKILKKHKNDKGIIHTANYELQRWINEKFHTNGRLLAHDSTNRNEMLEMHYNTEEKTVLVSPSMMVGVDLNGDFSRFQVIVKVPYPNLGSKKIKKRMETMQEYYGITTVRDIIQSYGRSIRSHDDFASTYILDGCFADVVKYNKHYFPKWVLDAIQYVN